MLTYPEPDLAEFDDGLPPQDLDAERSVLGAMMMSKDAIGDVSEIVRGVDFYRPAHEAIFDAIVDLYAKGEPADAVTVAAELARREILGRVGGPSYLHDLLACVSLASNAPWYARIVADKAVLRRLGEASVKIGQLSRAGGDVQAAVDTAQQAVYDVTDTRHRSDYARAGTILGDVLDGIEAAARGDDDGGLPTGLADLDAIIGGLQAGQLIIVAARPGVGKSTLGLDIAREAAVHCHETAAIFSLEMTRAEIVQRLLAAESGVDLKRIRRGTLDETDWNRIAAHTDAITGAPLFIDDSPNLTIMEIRAKARRLKQREDLRLLVVDYLQLMSSGRRYESRQVEVAEYSRQLKLLAKEIDVPVVALSQLNRASEQRADKKPMLSDLRESGALEQDADLVLLLNRDDLYNPNSPMAGQAEVTVAKHRNGQTGAATVAFQGRLARFASLTTLAAQPGRDTA